MECVWVSFHVENQFIERLSGRHGSPPPMVSSASAPDRFFIFFGVSCNWVVSLEQIMKLEKIGLVFLFGLSCNASSANDELIKKADLLWAYFDCAVYAELANPEMQLGLFEKGMEIGREYYRAQLAGQVTNEMVQQIPWVISRNTGPTPDFSLGSLWADRVSDISDDVDQKYKCDSWSSVEPYHFTCHKELRDEMFKDKFREKNCALLP